MAVAATEVATTGRSATVTVPARALGARKVAAAAAIGCDDRSRQRLLLSLGVINIVIKFDAATPARIAAAAITVTMGY